MEKRMFSIFLILCMVLCLLPASTWATVSTDEPGGEQSPVTEITVNDGTEEYYAIPQSNSYPYSVSQYVIPAEDLTAVSGRAISDLTYYGTS